MMAARDLRYTTHVGKNEHLFNCEPYIIYSISPQQTIVEDKTHTPGSPETFLHMARRLFLFFGFPSLMSFFPLRHSSMDFLWINEYSWRAVMMHVSNMYNESLVG